MEETRELKRLDKERAMLRKIEKERERERKRNADRKGMAEPTS